MSYVAALAWLWIGLSAYLAFSTILDRNARARPFVWVVVAMWPLVAVAALLEPLWSPMFDEMMSRVAKHFGDRKIRVRARSA